MIIFRYATALALLATLLCSPSLTAVAPPARAVELPAGFGEFFTRANRWYLAGRFPQRATAGGPQLAAAAPASLNLPVILTSFADLPGSLAVSQFENMLFGSYPSGSMKDYYAEVSGGRFALGGRVYGWVSVELSRADYLAGGSLGDETLFPRSPGGFVAHAVKAADGLVDFSRYDNDGLDGVPNSGDDDGLVDALIVVHPGGDAALGASDNFWSHTWNLGSNAVATNDPAAGGGFIKVDGYSLVPELAGAGGSTLPAGIGVFCHEFGHQLGLPDLYETTGDGNSGQPGQSNGIGYWGLMAYGSYGGDGRHPDRPVHPCAWSKLRLGWLAGVIEDTVGALDLEPVASGFKAVRVWDNDDRALSYFLLSCRTRAGFDSTLPGEGLLIWRVDEGAFDNTNPLRKLVELEQADGRDDLGRGTNYGDSGDPYPGSSTNPSFTGTSNPSSTRYDGAPSGVEITEIKFTAARASFRLGAPARPRFTLAYDEDGPGGARGFGYGGNLAHAAVIFTLPKAGTLEALSTYFAYDSMEYTVELYTGIDSGWLKCPVSWQQGRSPAAGWRTVELKQPVWLAAGDTVAAVVGYRSAGFAEGYPVPVDWTGRDEGRSFANFSGLGRFEPVGGDVSLRAVIRPGEPAAGAILLGPQLAPLPGILDFGLVFSGESYSLVLPLKNFGYRSLPLKRVDLTGGGYFLPELQPAVPCNGVNHLQIWFDPASGDGPGELEIVLLHGESRTVALAAAVAGYSVRYDSAQAPAGIGVYTEAAHGAVTFLMPRTGVVAGVRTYALQDSMKLSLRLWGEAGGGRGRCLLVETADTLIASRGWHQLRLPVGVEVDSADSFVADLRYETPGRSLNDLIPVDTARIASRLCFYNQRENDAWLVSRRPVAIRALIEEPESFAGEVLVKRARPELNDSWVAFDSLTVGARSDTNLWLYNRGAARFEAEVVFIPDDESISLAPAPGRLALACGDSILLKLGCLLSEPGVHTGTLELRDTSTGRVLLQAGISAAARVFEVSYDEYGFTASAGFTGPAATAAVVFTAPWDGTLDKILLHLNQPDMTVSARVFLGIDGVGAWSDTVALVHDTVVAESGWQVLPLDRPVPVLAGDSFAVLVALTGATNYPLSIDHRGPVSGRSQAAGSVDGRWEVLSYDLNLRAVLETAIPALFRVSGRVFAAGAPLTGALVTLQSAAASYRARSGADGAFAVPVVAGGSYELKTEYNGYRFKPLALTVDRALEGIAVRGRKEGAGDVDGSGRLDIFDLLELLKAVAGRRPFTSADDVDGSGRVDVFDLVELLAIINGG